MQHINKQLNTKNKVRVVKSQKSGWGKNFERLQFTWGKLTLNMHENENKQF
jgi:hypothetical protein